MYADLNFDLKQPDLKEVFRGLIRYLTTAFVTHSKVRVDYVRRMFLKVTNITCISNRIQNNWLVCCVEFSNVNDRKN